MNNEELSKFLDEPIPSDVVKEREGGGGKTLSYLEGHYVIDRLNKAFGHLGWSSRTDRLDCVHQGKVKNKYGKEVYTCHYIAQVTLSVSIPEELSQKNGDKYGMRLYSEHTGTGYGDGSDKENPGKAHELAVKEAETDALKRAAIRFGQSMGLALYDKEQKNVSFSSEKEETDVKVEVTAPPEPKAQESILNLISSTSKVLVAKKLTTLPELKNELDKRYGVTKKEELSSSQAENFLSILNQKLKGQENGTKEATN